MTVAGIFQSKRETKYIPFLIGQIGRGIQQAVLQLEPARVGWAVVLWAVVAVGVVTWVLPQGRETRSAPVETKAPLAVSELANLGNLNAAMLAQGCSVQTLEKNEKT